MKQGPRPDVETGLQCHCSKTDADASNCTTELLHNHLAGSTDRVHSEDNGTARHVAVAVSPPAETPSSPGKDGTLMSARRRKALGKVLAVVLAACLLGAILVLSVYLLGESTVPVHVIATVASVNTCKLRTCGAFQLPHAALHVHETVQYMKDMGPGACSERKTIHEVSKHGLLAIYSFDGASTKHKCFLCV